MLGLTAGSVEQRKSDELSAMARAKSITFKWTTFFELQRAIAQHVAEYETSLIAVVRDYEDYLRSENLLQSRDDWLLVVPCGQSYEENRKFSLYYDGVDRPSRSGCRYLGIYKNRAISLLGDIVCVAVCSYKDGQVQLEREEYGKLTEERRARVKAAIEETAYYDLKSTTQRFFITDGLYETDIRKSTPSGIQGALYLSVDGLLRSRRDPSWDTAQLAEHLRGSSFPLPKDS